MRHLLSLLCCLLPLSAAAADRVWIVGGGPELEHSQVQIERNVAFARRVMAERLPRARIGTWFTDGDDPRPDVKEWRRPDEADATLQPLARVLDTYMLNGNGYRNHRLADVDGPASRRAVLDALERGLPALGAGEEGWLVYAGHGSPAAPAEGGSLLDLWDHDRVTVADLQRVVASAGPAPGSRFRFVMTQCHAGGFARLAWPDGRAPDGRICGFMAVAEDGLAEGCTADLDAGNYRGYSTYFFAALSGRARDGAPLAFDPDGNSDGRVDPYEAHLYTLVAARSTDIPRSTSEQWLLDQAPWYLPLVPVTPAPDNPFRPLVTELARTLGIDPAVHPLRRAIHPRRLAWSARLKALSDRQDRHRAAAAGARGVIARELVARFPEVRWPHTRGYSSFLREDLDQAQALIRSHPLYAPMREDQDAYWRLDGARLELERQLALLDRLEHLDALARRYDHFAARPDTPVWAAYTRLNACERAPLGDD